MPQLIGKLESKQLFLTKSLSDKNLINSHNEIILFIWEGNKGPYLIFLLFSEGCTAGIALLLLVSPSRHWYRPPVAGIALLHWRQLNYKFLVFAPTVFSLFEKACHEQDSNPCSWVSHIYWKHGCKTGIMSISMYIILICAVCYYRTLNNLVWIREDWLIEGERDNIVTTPLVV